MKKRVILSLLLLVLMPITPVQAEANDVWYVDRFSELDIIGEEDEDAIEGRLEFVGSGLNGEERTFYVSRMRAFSVWPMSKFTPMYLELKRIEPGLPAWFEIEATKNLTNDRYKVESIRVVEVEHDPDDPEKPIVREDSGIFGNRLNEFYNDPRNRPSMAERTMSDVVIGVANWMFQLLSMQDVTILVFGKNPNPTDDGFMQGDCSVYDCREGNYLGVLTEGMMLSVEALYSTFERFLPYPVFFSLLLIGFLILWHSMSAEGRTKTKDYILGFIIALIAIRFGHYVWMFAAWIAHHFTDLIWYTMANYGIQPDKFLNMIWGAGSAGYYQMTGMRSLGVGLLVFTAAMMTAVLNWQYAIRTIMLMVLMVIFVPACVLSIFPKFRHSLNTWFEQFIANMFMPCAHAVALGLFFLLLRFSSDGVSMWIIFGYFFGLPMVVGLFHQLLGMQEESGGFGGAFGTLLGISAIKGVASVLRPSPKGGQIKGISNSDPTGSGSAENESQPASQPAAVQRQEGTKLSAGQRIMGGIGKTASFGLKAAGVVGGATVGTMITGNPATGMVGGAALGKGAASFVDKATDGFTQTVLPQKDTEQQTADEAAPSLEAEAKPSMDQKTTAGPLVQPKNASEWMQAQGMKRSVLPAMGGSQLEKSPQQDSVPPVQPASGATSPEPVTAPVVREGARNKPIQPSIRPNEQPEQVPPSEPVHQGEPSGVKVAGSRQDHSVISGSSHIQHENTPRVRPKNSLENQGVRHEQSKISTERSITSPMVKSPVQHEKPLDKTRSSIPTREPVRGGEAPELKVARHKDRSTPKSKLEKPKKNLAEQYRSESTNFKPKGKRK